MQKSSGQAEVLADLLYKLTLNPESWGDFMLLYPLSPALCPDTNPVSLSWVQERVERS